MKRRFSHFVRLALAPVVLATGLLFAGAAPASALNGCSVWLWEYDEPMLNIDLYDTIVLGGVRYNYVIFCDLGTVYVD